MLNAGGYFRSWFGRFERLTVRRPDPWLAGPAVVLIVLGLMMVLNTTYFLGHANGDDGFHYFKMQLGHIAVGLAVCAAHALVYYRPIIKSLALTAGSALTVYVGSWVPLIVREHRNAFYLFTANAYILQFHRHATTDLRPGEPWWTWIFRLDLQEAPMELIANPVIGILGLVAITVLLWRQKPLLPALYIAHILQWAVVSYHWSHYYYYLEAFTWLTVALAVSMQDVKIGRVRLDIIVAACALGAVAWPFWKAMQ